MDAAGFADEWDARMGGGQPGAEAAAGADWVGAD